MAFKKITSLITAGVLALAVTACTAEGPGSAPANTGNPTAPDDGQITVAFSFKETDADGLPHYVADLDRCARVARIAVRLPAARFLDRLRRPRTGLHQDAVFDDVGASSGDTLVVNGMVAHAVGVRGITDDVHDVGTVFM